jgi:hypothetical protein
MRAGSPRFSRFLADQGDYEEQQKAKIDTLLLQNDEQHVKARKEYSRAVNDLFTVGHVTYHPLEPVRVATASCPHEEFIVYRQELASA